MDIKDKLLDITRQRQAGRRLRKMRSGLKAVSLTETEYKRAMLKKKVIKMMLVGMIPVATAVGMFKLMNNGKIDDKKLTAKFTEWKENWKKNQDNKPVNNSEELIEIEGYEHLQCLLNKAREMGYSLEDVKIDPECHIEVNNSTLGTRYLEGEYSDPFDKSEKIRREKPKKPNPDEEYSEEGMISYYAGSFVGRHTSTGAIFTGMEPTAAHRTFPIPSLAIITNLDNGKEVLVVFNDAGPFVNYKDDCPKEKRRIADVSAGVAEKLEIINGGTGSAKVTYMSFGSDMLRLFMKGKTVTNKDVEEIAGEDLELRKKMQKLVGKKVSQEVMQSIINNLEYQVAVDNWMNEIVIKMSEGLKGQRASLGQIVDLYNTSVACYDMMNGSKKDLKSVVELAMRLTSDTAYYADYLKYPKAFNFPKSDGRA